MRRSTASRRASSIVSGGIMKKIYGGEGGSPSPKPLSNEAHALIGRCIRAWAEFETLVSLRIFKLTGIREDLGIRLLGTSPIRAKIDMLEDLEKISEDAVVINEEEKTNISLLLKARNALAHGQYIGTAKGKVPGRDIEDRYCFLTIAVAGPHDGKIAREVISLAEQDIQKLAEESEFLISHFGPKWKLEAFLEERRKRPLRPHRKSQQKKPSRSTP